MKYRDGVPDIRLVASEELTCGKRLRKEERFHESELFLGKRRLTLEVYTQPVKCSHGSRDRVAKVCFFGLRPGPIFVSRDWRPMRLASGGWLSTPSWQAQAIGPDNGTNTGYHTDSSVRVVL